jgi:AAA domain
MTSPLGVGTLLSDVQPEQVRWLWQGRIPLGKITVIDGDPGLGKSLITLDLAARITRGREMPDGTPGPQGGVVLASGEDGLADTVRPRLEVAGADLTRIVDITVTVQEKGQLLTIPDDLARLEQAIVRVGAVLVVIDPVYSFLNHKVNTDKDSQIRQALSQLAKLAERLGVAIVLVRHLNKADEKKAIYRGGGSMGLIGLARSGLLVAKSRKSQGNVLASVKCNLAARPPAMVFSVEATPRGIPLIDWLGEGTETADELTLQFRPNKTHQAAIFLTDALSKEPLPSKALEVMAAQAGIASKTYQRARKVAGVESRQTRDGWLSSMPTQMVTPSDGQALGKGDGEQIAGGLA